MISSMNKGSTLKPSVMKTCDFVPAQSLIAPQGVLSSQFYSQGLSYPWYGFQAPFKRCWDCLPHDVTKNSQLLLVHLCSLSHQLWIKRIGQLLAQGHNETKNELVNSVFKQLLTQALSKIMSLQRTF